VFGKCHEGSAKPEEWSIRLLCEQDIYDVENSLNNIHESGMIGYTTEDENQEKHTLGVTF